MAKNPTRNYAIEYVGGKREDAAAIVSAAIAAAAEPTGDPLGDAGDTDLPLLETLPTGETDTTLVPHPDGVGGVAWGVSPSQATLVAGDISNPPTEAELEIVAGVDPATVPGKAYLVEDSDTARQYLAISDGIAFQIAPTVRPQGAGAAPTVVAITAAPAGGWTQITNERATSGGNGKTYIGYIRGDNGDICVRSVTETSGVTDTERVLHAAFEVDLHDPPCVLIRDSDHKLLAFYSKHVGTGMFLRISTNSIDSDPTLSGGFAAEVNLDSSLGGTGYTYPSAFQLLGMAGDPIYLMYRDHVGTAVSWCYATSTDGGATWSAQTRFLAGVGTRSPYLSFESDGDTRIDVAASDGHPVGDAPTKVYHCYFNAGSFFTSDGAAIASLPMAAGAGTEVYDGSDGSGWPENVTLVGGRPIFGLEVLLGGSSDSYRYAYWTGTAWSVNEIVQSNGLIEGVGPHFAIDRVAPSMAYASVKVSSHFEIKQYVTTDGGATWALVRSVTSASSVDNILPVSPRNRSPHLKLVWLAGTYTTYLSNSLGVKGLVA